MIWTKITSRIIAAYSVRYSSLPTQSMQCLICVGFQIAGLLKDNEKIQSNPEVPPSEDDTEIKKIKKVRSDCFGAVQF